MRKDICNLIFITITQVLFAQNQAPCWTLNQPVNGGIHEYQASEYIKMLPGFRYVPGAPGDKFTAITNSSFVFAPQEGTIGGPGGFGDGVVGAIPGFFDITPNGAAEYSVPISLPPGINNLTPNLALVYNSLMENSVMGQGWNLAGISSISRGPSSFFHDGFVNQVSFNSWDRFYFDGQRLILNAGSYGGNNSEYRTEQDVHSRITAFSQLSSGPEKFLVEGRDGTKWEFGYTRNSRVEDNAVRGKVLHWLVNRIYDRFGNYIDFEYEQNTNGTAGARIKRIFYTGNNNQQISPFYEIFFEYENRPDQERKYFGGVLLSHPQRAKEIKIKYLPANEVLYSYLLNNQIANGVSQLISIELIDREGNKFNPTNFQYGESPAPYSVIQGQVGGTNKVPNAFFFYDDFNGDGFSDYIKTSDNNTFIEVFLNQKDGTFSKAWEIELPNSTSKQDSLLYDHVI